MEAPARKSDTSDQPLSLRLVDTGGWLFSLPGLDPFAARRHLIDWVVGRLQTSLVGGLDLVPYTERFEGLFDEVISAHGEALRQYARSILAPTTRNAFWRLLLHVRKSGELGIVKPNPRRRAHRQPAQSPMVIAVPAGRIIETRVEMLASRSELENLPYTDQFDELYCQISTSGAGSPASAFSKHQVWVAIVRFMKRCRWKPVRAQTPGLFE